MVELIRGGRDRQEPGCSGIHRGAFDDPRAELLFTDGVAFVAETDRQFDVIILDTTDPMGAGEYLFTEAFYADCRARLRPGGISGRAKRQSGRRAGAVPRLPRAARPVFADASFILSAVPAYLGGPFVFAWGCDDPAKRRLSAQALGGAPVPAEPALLYRRGARGGLRPSPLAARRRP